MNNNVEIYYFDDNGNIVDVDKATRSVIRELDVNGNLVNETWNVLSKEPVISDDEFDDYILELEKNINK